MGKSRSSISVWRIASPEPLGPTADYLTEAGRVMGTVGYMSPEQACGDIPDGRGDIFSLGCMLYEMATGCRAFPGDNAIAVLAAILRDQPADMDASGRRFPPDVKLLVSRCLAKQPGDRFRSVNEVAIALKKLVVGTVRTPAVASGSVTRPCVAVLPLQNFSANKTETDYMVDGMTEVLIAELAKNRSLRVVSRTTVMQFKDSRSPIRQIARELGADEIIEGSVLLAGSSARITAQLIRAETDEHRWAESYQREVRDVLALQSEVSASNRRGDQEGPIRRRLSLRVAARPGDADSPARRLRPCGRGDAAGVRGGGPAMAPGRDSSKTAGMASFDRAIQGHRCGSSPCSSGLVTQTRGSLSRGCRRRRCGARRSGY